MLEPSDSGPAVDQGAKGGENNTLWEESEGTSEAPEGSGTRSIATTRPETRNKVTDAARQESGRREREAQSAKVTRNVGLEIPLGGIEKEVHALNRREVSVKSVKGSARVPATEGGEDEPVVVVVVVVTEES